MPKQAFPAAAEGMPRINRRAILGGIAAAPVVALPAVACAPLRNEKSEPEWFSAESIDQLMRAAFLYGCLPTEQKKVALAQMMEIARRDGDLK